MKLDSCENCGLCLLGRKEFNMAWLGKAIGAIGTKLKANYEKGGDKKTEPALPSAQQTPGFGASVGVNGTTNPRGIGKWGQGA
jgi:hypothetical protein